MVLIVKLHSTAFILVYSVTWIVSLYSVYFPMANLLSSCDNNCFYTLMWFSSFFSLHFNFSLHSFSQPSHWAFRFNTALMGDFMDNKMKSRTAENWHFYTFQLFDSSRMKNVITLSALLKLWCSCINKPWHIWNANLNNCKLKAQKQRWEFMQIFAFKLLPVCVFLS